jgi:hypothetical protein
MYFMDIVVIVSHLLSHCCVLSIVPSLRRKNTDMYTTSQKYIHLDRVGMQNADRPCAILLMTPPGCKSDFEFLEFTLCPNAFGFSCSVQTTSLNDYFLVSSTLLIFKVSSSAIFPALYDALQREGCLILPTDASRYFSYHLYRMPR